jgi:hypothetical protein
MLQQRLERIETHRYLRTKYQELREEFTRWRHRYYLIQCAWCQRRIGWKRKMDAVSGDTSHGICPSCATDLFRKIHTRKYGQAGSSSPAPQHGRHETGETDAAKRAPAA